MITNETYTLETEAMVLGFMLNSPGDPKKRVRIS